MKLNAQNSSLTERKDFLTICRENAFKLMIDDLPGMQRRNIGYEKNGEKWGFKFEDILKQISQYSQVYINKRDRHFDPEHYEIGFISDEDLYLFILLDVEKFENLKNTNPLFQKLIS